MNVEQIKIKISNVVTNAMLRKNLTTSELAKAIRVSQARIGSVLSVTDRNLDLEALYKMCNYLGIRITVHNKSRKLSSNKSAKEKRGFPETGFAYSGQTGSGINEKSHH